MCMCLALGGEWMCFGCSGVGGEWVCGRGFGQDSGGVVLYLYEL